MADDSTPPAGFGPAGAGGDQWVFLIDPAWEATEAQQRPPAQAVVGGWFVAEDGSTGKFHANPDYDPSSPASPTDPVDATLQLVTRGEAQTDALLSTLREATFGIAVDEQHNPVVTPSPDDVPSVLVTTAPAHRQRVNVPGWHEVSATELAEVLPDEGVDVLLNPGAPASMRILAGALKRAVAEP